MQSAAVLHATYDVSVPVPYCLSKQTPEARVGPGPVKMNDALIPVASE